MGHAVVYIVYYATSAYSITLRTSADRPSVSRSTPELHTLFYAILCVKFDITSVRTELRNHLRQSKMAGYIGGKRGCMGVRSGSRGAVRGGGAAGEAPAGGLGGGEPPHWLNNTFLFWRRNENTNQKIRKIHSKKKCKI